MTVRTVARDNNQKEKNVYAMRRLLTPLTLKLYDAFVLGFSSQFIWRCPRQELISLHDRNVTGRHLDVGVGTGYLLDRTTFPTTSPRITLIDINEHCLSAAAGRISRYHPRKLMANILDPVPVTGKYDSVSMCYLLHCLPGNMGRKAIVFDNIRHLLSQKACVFGATLVQGDAPRSPAARVLMKYYNEHGIFSNTDDQFDELKLALESRFRNVQMQLRGCVALFEARDPK